MRFDPLFRCAGQHIASVLGRAAEAPGRQARSLLRPASRRTPPRSPRLVVIKFPVVSRAGPLPASRKRKASDAVEDSMFPSAKRLAILDIVTPWAYEKWYQLSNSDLHEPSSSLPPSAPRRSPSPLPQRTLSKKASPERFHPYRRKSPPTKVLREMNLSLTRDVQHSRWFWWATPKRREGSTSLERDTNDNASEAVSSDRDSNNSTDKDLTPIRLTLPSDTACRATTKEEGTEQDESISDFDDEEGRKWRKFLRSQQESFDEDGYKLPINSVLSPEAQQYNDDRQKELIKEAMLEHGTPSKPPEVSSSILVKREAGTKGEGEKDDILTTVTAAEDGSNSQLEPVVLTDSMRGESIPYEQSQAYAGMKDDKQPRIATKTKSEEASAFETPNKQLMSLTLGLPSAQSDRTPKATLFSTIKTDRRTRTQRLIEEREAAKDKYKLVPLGTKWEAKVKDAVKSGTNDQKFAATDFARVVPEYSTSRYQDNWLNDAVINDYIEMIAQHGRKGDRPTQVPSHVGLSSFMYKNLTEKGPSSVSGMVKRKKINGKNLLECEKIFIAINQGAHWTLAVVEPKHHKRITIYNSMGFSRGIEVASNLLNWIRHELGNSFKEQEWTMNPRGFSPQQTNSDDCGVFTCTTARQVMLGKMDKMPYKADIIPIQRKRMVAELINKGLLTAEESQ